MRRLRRWMRVVAAVGLMTAALGVVVLLAQSLSEVLTDPTLSLEDGYLIGRLPWTAVGVDLVVFGSSAALVAGVGAAWPAGGVLRRVAAALAFMVGLSWWIFAVVVPLSGGACDGCAQPGPDPITVAYSMPQATVVLLLIPAIVTGVLGLTGSRASRRALPSPRRASPHT